MRIGHTAHKIPIKQLLSFIQSTAHRNWHIDAIHLTQLLNENSHLLTHSTMEQNEPTHQYLLRAHAHCQLIELIASAQKHTHHLKIAVYSLLLSMLSLDLSIKRRYQNAINLDKIPSQIKSDLNYQIFFYLNKSHQFHLQQYHIPSTRKPKAVETILMTREEHHIECVSRHHRAWGKRRTQHTEIVKTEYITREKPKSNFTPDDQQLLNKITSALKDKVAQLNEEIQCYKKGSRLYSLTHTKQDSLLVLSNKIQKAVSLVAILTLLTAAIQNPAIRRQRFWTGKILNVASLGFFKSSSHRLLLQKQKKIKYRQAPCSS